MSFASITFDRNIVYPPIDQFSPYEKYPEYPFSTFSPSPNLAYGLVRRCLRDSGADAAHFGTSLWNPLGEWLKPGQRVFVLPNFVMHRRSGESLNRFYAKCTHGAVLRAVLDYATIACADPHLISFGNAPIQACDYARVAKETGATNIADFYQKTSGAKIGPFDLRQLVSSWTWFGALKKREQRSSESAVTIDLGSDSWLDDFYHGVKPQLRVGDYAPSETMSYHGKGKHEYVINRRVLEACVIISVPKLKSHQKVGLTCGLKGTVGVIGQKQCLAHYRKGGSGSSGDEYPRDTPWRQLVSRMIDEAAQHGPDIKGNTLRISSKLLAKIVRTGSHSIMGGAWYGNDTAWRMALDIARILRYARPDGTLSTTPQREHLVLVDGIVAGEGEGPLRPRSQHIGALVFAPDVCAADVACALLAGYDPLRIPLVRHSFDQRAFPLSAATFAELAFAIDGRATPMSEVGPRVCPGKRAGLKPPIGWKGRIELDGSRTSAL